MARRPGALGSPLRLLGRAKMSAVSDVLIRAAHDQARSRSTFVGPASDIQHRLIAYRSRVGQDYQCPCCWIRDDAHSALVAVPGTEREDKFRCYTCGAGYLVPLGD